MAYPYYPTVNFQPNYYNQQFQPQTAPMAQQNILPPQQVLQANGKPSIDALRMSPNSSALIMDTTAPIVWLCTSDSLGNVTPTPYDISLHKDAEKAAVGDFEARLSAVENNVNGIIAKWEEMTNVKSDVGHGKSKSANRNDGTD